MANITRQQTANCNGAANEMNLKTYSFLHFLSCQCLHPHAQRGHFNRYLMDSFMESRDVFFCIGRPFRDVGNWIIPHTFCSESVE